MSAELASPPGLEITRASTMFVLGIAIPLALQCLDKRRLSATYRAGAWNFASWGSALYAFGPLSMLGWAWVTRPRWRRIAVGAAGTTLAALILSAIDLLIAVVFTRHLPEDATDLPLGVAIFFAGSATLLLAMELCVSAARALRRLLC